MVSDPNVCPHSGGQSASLGTWYRILPTGRGSTHLDFTLVLLRLPHRAHDRAARRERAEEDVDVEGVEAPPDEGRGEEAGGDRAAEGGAEGHLDGAAAAGGGDDRRAVEEAEWPEREWRERDVADARQH